MKYIYEHRQKPRARAIFLAASVLATAWIYVVLYVVNAVYPVAFANAPEGDHNHPYVVTKAKPLSQRDVIIKDIYEVFGKENGDKFLLILTQGKPGTNCPRGENPTLDPYARNWNNDKYNSVDYGIGQINDHWQGVTNTDFLFDYDLNIRFAHKIFLRWGNFQAWTCGKVWGI